LGRIDPSGLGWVNGVFEVKIAFYDGGDDPESFWDIGGTGWKECADDDYFDIAINIRQGETWGYGQNGQPGPFGDLTDFVIRELGNPKDWAGRTEYNEYLNTHSGDYSKLEITDVYIFDHGREGGGGLDIGDEQLNSGSSQLTAFLGGVGTALTNTGSDAVIHFRGCQIGDNRSFLQELAAGTGHNVTGLKGDINLPLLAYILEIPGPDYGYDALYMATPTGVVPSLVWKNKTIITTDKWGFHVWLNPWGPQPY